LSAAALALGSAAAVAAAEVAVAGYSPAAFLDIAGAAVLADSQMADAEPVATGERFRAARCDSPAERDGYQEHQGGEHFRWAGHWAGCCWTDHPDAARCGYFRERLDARRDYSARPDGVPHHDSPAHSVDC
jgi:hypothetical protein